MTLLDHYRLSLLLTTATSITLGCWVLAQRRKSKVVRIFFVYIIGLGFWSFAQAAASFTDNPGIALTWVRAMFYAVITFPLLLTYFFSAFLEIDRPKICLFGWLLILGFLPVLSTDLFLQRGGAIGFLSTMPRAGILFLPFNVVWIAWFLYDVWLLGTRSRELPPTKRRQAYLLLSVFVLGYITGCTNYLYMYGICLAPLQPLATYGCPVAVLMIAHGIFAYGLFDINVVIRRSLAYSLLVTVLTIGYFGLVYFVERTFQTTFGYQSIRVSLTAFALMALTFQPLKIGIQRLVDWLFFRAPHEELAKRLERLEQETQQTEKLKAVATLAAGMAHEIKNPLSSIKTFAEFLPQKYDDPSFREKFARIINQEVGKINDLVQCLLDFAKPAQPQKQPVRIAQLMDDTIELLHGRLLSKHIEVARAYSHEDNVCVDAGQMKQVFLNVLLNSIDAIKDQGCISVATVAENSHVEIVIADTGSGIPRKELLSVFDPFYTTKANGTGLGLSVVHSIIQEHAGRVTIESDTSRGTTVRIQLPIADSRPQTSAKQA